MTIKFRDFSIDTDLFDSPVYVRDFDLIAFTTVDGLLEQRITLNLCFECAESARKTFFSIHKNLVNGTRNLDMSNVPCTWPKNVARVLDSYISLDCLPNTIQQLI